MRNRHFNVEEYGTFCYIRYTHENQQPIQYKKINDILWVTGS